jgi:hypothetical protein
MVLVSNHLFYLESLTVFGEQIRLGREFVEEPDSDSRLHWKMRAFTMEN